ncbi:cytochrome c oxidase subunit 3 [Caenimonas aquaedulcis]|uniref:Cytochrome c oxidase subunit 3 n=1 Tax=Caenimonas aquaedulcis TaxID=2793270 RepID=A0A931H334_9BURK|nr:cytochrome c oxidase subunit 3 [Caenimonas aquaedulcis]MBG9387615.1 cytochrome c oxidase subunit 3 [Caenimonas aquaedulcis]
MTTAATPASRSDATLDVSGLPSFRFSHHSPMWWGTLGMIAIEGTVFALAIASYFYLRMHSNTWPMFALPPDLFWGTLNTAVMLGSLVPNQLAKSASERLDLPAVRLWLSVALVFAFLFLGVRVMEFASLNVRWDSNAYGSIVWTLLGLHTTHLITDTIDTTVLDVLFFTGPLDGRRFVDVSENCFYWYFVVGSWLPIYLVIYWGARPWPS